MFKCSLLIALLVAQSMAGVPSKDSNATAPLEKEKRADTMNAYEKTLQFLGGIAQDLKDTYSNMVKKGD